jgi:MFS family permease
MLLFLLGAGSGIAFSPLTSAIMGEASLKDRGATSGLMRVMSNLGSTLGVASVMCVAALVAGPKIAQVAAHLIPLEELVPAFDMAFLFCMLLEVAGIALMLTVKARSMVTAMERTTAA